MKKVCKELIDFFENQESWDKNELISEFCSEILKKHNIHCGIDELYICDGEKNIDLEEFVEELFDKIIDGVCNVIKTT